MAKLDFLSHQLQLLLAKPALAQPTELIIARLEANRQKRDLIYRITKNKLSLETSDLSGLRSTLKALSPQGTLERGFAIVRDEKGRVVNSAEVARTKDKLNIKFADDSVSVKPIN